MQDNGVKTLAICSRSAVLSAIVAYLSTIIVWSLLASGLSSALLSSFPFAAAIIYDPDGMAQLISSIRSMEQRAHDSGSLGGNSPSRDCRADVTLKVLHSHPLDSNAILCLAYLARASNNEGLADKAFAEAYRRSFRHPTAAAELFRKSITKGDVRAAVEYLDALLRADPSLLSVIGQFLVSVGNDPSTRQLLATVIARAPPWRAAFLEIYANTRGGESAIVDLNTRLKDSKGAFSANELDALQYKFLVSNHVDEALTLWLSTLPEQRIVHSSLLYNGKFELPINNSPFNWRIYSSHNATATVAEHPTLQEGKSLNVEFSARRGRFAEVTEWLALASGQYRLRGRYKTETFRSSRGLIWRVYCWTAAGAAKVIGETTQLIDSNGAWQQFVADFNVPDSDCAAQVVQLETAARISVEEINSGGVWFADMELNKR